MTNPRTKGKRGEYKVRDALTEWYGVSFKRTPSSGAFATINKMYEFIGDLVCDDPTFPFCVEVKNNESWEMGQLLTSKSPPILKWWEQATVQATKSEKYPILVILKNRSQPLVVANATFFFAVTRKAKIPFLTLTLPDHEVLYIFKLDDVVSHTKVRA